MSEKYIGKNNPKEKYIKENNKLKYFLTINYEENRYKVNYFIKEVQFIYKDIARNEVKEYNYINDDINTLNINMHYNRNLNSMQEIIISYYEPETNTRSKPSVIEILKVKLTKNVRHNC